MLEFDIIYRITITKMSDYNVECPVYSEDLPYHDPVMYMHTLVC